MVQFDCIEGPLSRAFDVYGRFIARHPIWFLVSPLLLTAALGSGFYNFHSEYDVEKLFSPEGARSKDERSILQSLFNESAESEPLNPNRMTTLGEYGRIIVTSKVADGNVLTKAVYNEVLQLDKDIQNITVNINAKHFSYRDLCIGSCKNATNPLIILCGDNTTILSHISYPIHSITQRYKLFLGSTIGGVTTDPNTKAKAWSLYYYLRTDNNYKDAVKKWQETFVSILAKKSHKYIIVTRFTAHSLEDELKRNANAVFPLFSILFSVLITFSIVSCMSSDWVRSKPWLGNLGVLSAGLAVVSSFGLVLHAGIPFIDIVASSPFLVLGIGVDDMFVMLAAWRQTDFRWSVEERMGKAFSEAALSITITSITDALSIGIGAITKFRSVQIFCTYTAIAVIFDYFYQITFFAACMVLTGHREAANRHPATCMKAVPKSLAGKRNALYRVFCTGGYTDEEMKNSKNTADVNAMTFFRDSWGGLLSTRPFKILLAHVYLLYLGFAIWGCLTVEEGISLDRLAGDGSYVADYYDQDIKYFREYGPVVTVNVDKDLELWNKNERSKIDKMLQKFEKSDYFHDKRITTAWIRDFSELIGNNTIDSSNVSSILRNSFKSSSLDYNLDINSSKVTSSRYFVCSKNIDTSTRESKMMLTARDIADNNKDDLDVTVFHPAFIFYDQYLAVWPNTRQNLLIATAAMFLVSLLLIPHPLCSLWVTFSIVSICTGVIGYMTWWGVNLDTISMINIIICIGFCVDFSAHITYAFILAEGSTGNERMRGALHALGYPIAQGALSTILGVSALAFSASYIFRSFFKTMFLVIFLGAFHGLLVIPVLLSIMGPPKLTKKRQSVSPIDHPKVASMVDGVDSCRRQDIDRLEPDRGFGRPLEYQSKSTNPIRPRPMRYDSTPDRRGNEERGQGNNGGPMPFPNGNVPPRYAQSAYSNGWPAGNSYMPSLSGRGRPQDKFSGPHEYFSPMSDRGSPRDKYAGNYGYMSPKSDAGPPRYRAGPPEDHQMPNSWGRY